LENTDVKHLYMALLASLTCAAACAQSPAAAPATAPGPVATIAALDVPRYMGTWYEIAKYPNRFQKKCVADTKADYQLQAGGTVKVTNRCRKEDGSLEEAIGEARQIGVSTSPRLQVRFAPAWLSLLPFVWGDYWVIDLDERYQLVAVSEPQREYLWVLARTPTVSPEAYEALLGRLRAQGFDLARLERSRQTP
jgi:apolipoprotein D and lipocalin family protein